MSFQNRTVAGEQLAERIFKKVHAQKVLVLAIPRGGIPVALPVARKLNAPLDVLVVRKLTPEGTDRPATGALSAGGVQLLDGDTMEWFHLAPHTLNESHTLQMQALEKQEQGYRSGLHPLNLSGLTVVLIDDGMVTGATMRAAIQAVWYLGAKHLVVAVPQASRESIIAVQGLVDEVVCLETPVPYSTVRDGYAEPLGFTDAELSSMLRELSV
ncbi:phosphoribosyltransferase [Deinococcus cellulosilyticus]|uniref:Phosphoribosyl transferase n=1 Tax=Deinococcus cellulosilyticus (strain DSM 18568 / NBRC 106333 / KACC 11606 / 5516J-15) TaxID=1223518 RepID=A0A511N649_DEIC1|nr:phosphoribosyltransferase family protein [Deinococcus cellulosilyticus]GEM48339.1 phosphoribosyl transferase [Deinococcus cellulosilyticus NBRC 106333 = KACC 11606]